MSLRKTRAPRRPLVSAEKSFVCNYPDCNLSFYHKRHLRRHQTDKHGRFPRNTLRLAPEHFLPQEPGFSDVHVFQTFSVANNNSDGSEDGSGVTAADTSSEIFNVAASHHDVVASQDGISQSPVIADSGQLCPDGADGSNFEAGAPNAGGSQSGLDVLPSRRKRQNAKDNGVTDAEQLCDDPVRVKFDMDAIDSDE